MKAILIVQTPNGPALKYHLEVPIPRPNQGEILVRVRASGLNYADLRRSATHYGHGGCAATVIAGLEIAGEVVDAGSQSTVFAVRNRVMAMAAGAYAEYACVDSRLAVKVPDGFDWNQAAAIPISFMTGLPPVSRTVCLAH